MFHDRIEVEIVADEPRCTRPACGHPESDHDPRVGYCEVCACQGFLSAESFEAEVEEVEKLHLGEDNR